MSQTHSQLEDLARILEIQNEISSAEMDPTSLMSLVCRRAQDLVRGSGACIESADGEEMVLQVGSGNLQETAGLRTRSRDSLSGQAFLSEQVLYCMDAETDPRVDREVCRRTNTRSMICVPLIYKGKTTGVLKVISPDAHAFAEKEVSLLRVVAGLLSFAMVQAGEVSTKAAIFATPLKSA
jgi:putative methionine-R-sulfoxide reductase with GAF domain